MSYHKKILESKYPDYREKYAEMRNVLETKFGYFHELAWKKYAGFSIKKNLFFLLSFEEIDSAVPQNRQSYITKPKFHMMIFKYDKAGREILRKQIYDENRANRYFHKHGLTLIKTATFSFRIGTGKYLTNKIKELNDTPFRTLGKSYEVCSTRLLLENI